VFPPWFLPLWYGAVAFGWWRAAAIDVGATAPAGSTAASLALPLSLGGKFTGFLIESGFYWSSWKARGRDLPFWRFFCVIASASTADLLARLIAARARRDPGLGPWLAPLAGLDLAGGSALHWTAASRAAFGTLSLLTLLRIALTAEAQRAALELSFAKALVWTAAVWLLTRVALLFLVDLMTGMSPLPRG
jgi:hypothetical protein